MNSAYLNWPIPDEDLDPYYDIFVGMVEAIDFSTYALMATAGNMILPPSSVVLHVSGSVGTLVWNGDFMIPIIGSGYRLFARFGPDGVTRQIVLNDQDRVVITVPVTSTGDVIGGLGKVNGTIPAQDGLMTVGIFYGGQFYAKFPQVIAAS